VIVAIKFWQRLGVAAILLGLLSACGSDGNTRDLRDFMAEVAAKPQGRIQPLPEFQPYEPFKYGAANLRSPFQAPLEMPQRNEAVPPSQIRPPQNHVKSYLEGFNLSALQLVGSLKIRGAYYGLIRDADGLVHQVGVGAYLGTQWGRIENISENQLDLVEVVSNGGGGWLLRPRTIELNGASEG